MANKFRNVNITDYYRVLASRNGAQELAAIRTFKKRDELPANWLAKNLHPTHQYFIIENIRDLGEGVKCYTFVPDPDSETDHVAYFQAGQYLSVNLNIDGKYMTRAYSISSSPKMALEGKIELTIKLVPDGFVSNWIQENWKVGDKVDTSGPLGEFAYEPIRDAETVIGIAGGSGITPFLSMARAIADGDEDFDLILLYGSQKADSIVYKAELDELEKATDKFKVVHVLSNDDSAGYEHGFITAELIKKYAPEGDFSVFMCGPQAMYNFVNAELPKLGLRRKYIRNELFGELHGPKAMDEYPKNKTVPDTITIKVIQNGEETTITGSSDDSVLVILEKAGVKAPSHCRSGECGWCHSRLISGEVFCPSSIDGRRKADKKFGYIHPCATFPLSDLTIEVPLMD